MTKFVRYLMDKPWTDFITGGVLGIFFGSFDDRWIATMTSDNRATLYATAIQVSAGLLGLVAAVLALLKGTGAGRRLRQVRAKNGPAITKSMISALWSLVLVLVVVTSAFIAESGEPGRLALTLVYASLLIAMVRLARMLWVIGNVLQLDDADEIDSVRHEQRPAPNWIEDRHDF